MKLVMGDLPGGLSRVRLVDLLDESLPHCRRIRAAVAYANDPHFFKRCAETQIQLDFYGLGVDETIPVAPEVLKFFHESGQPGASENMHCWLVPGYFHPKVIWWERFGAYVGSANLTRAAWGCDGGRGNVECGVFFTEDDLLTNKRILQEQLNELFLYLGRADVSCPLTPELYACLSQISTEMWRTRAQRHDNEQERIRSRLKDAFGFLHTGLGGAPERVRADDPDQPALVSGEYASVAVKIAPTMRRTDAAIVFRGKPHHWVRNDYGTSAKPYTKRPEAPPRALPRPHYQLILDCVDMLTKEKGEAPTGTDLARFAARRAVETGFDSKDISVKDFYGYLVAAISQHGYLTVA